jgi:hypothetical protein
MLVVLVSAVARERDGEARVASTGSCRLEHHKRLQPGTTKWSSNGATCKVNMPCRRRRRGYTGYTRDYVTTNPSREGKQRDPLQGLQGRE